MRGLRRIAPTTAQGEALRELGLVVAAFRRARGRALDRAGAASDRFASGRPDDPALQRDVARLLGHAAGRSVLPALDAAMDAERVARDAGCTRGMIRRAYRMAGAR